MGKHLKNCLKCPKFIRQQFSEELIEITNAGKEYVHTTDVVNVDMVNIEEVNEESTSSSASVDSVKIKTSTSKTKFMSTFVDSISSSEKNDLDVLLARAIYSAQCPLQMTENADWNVFKKKRPSYKLLSRYLLSNKLLDSEFERVKSQVELKILSASSLALKCDGWSNRRNESIVNFILTTPAPVFFKTLPTNAERHTGEYMAKQIDLVISEIGHEHFTVIVTDNARNMESAKTILLEKYPNIVTYGCVAHILNLLIRDVMKLKPFSNIILDAKAIVKDVNNVHVHKSVFETFQKQTNSTSITLKLPVVTRWASIITCFKSLLDTKFALKKMAVSEYVSHTLNVRSSKCILDEEIFWLRVKKMYEILKPIGSWIFELEGDRPCINSAPQVFNEIKDHFEKLLMNSPLSKAEENMAIRALKKRKDGIIAITLYS